MQDFNLNDALNRAEQTLRLGTIAEIDNDKRLVRVQSAELLSNWIPYPASIGHNFIAWTPMRKGTQVMLGCPSGDFAQAVILQVLYTDELNSPSTDEAVDMIEFTDGTVIKKDAEMLTIDTPCAVKINTAKTLDLQSGAEMNLTAGGNMKLTAPKIDLN